MNLWTASEKELREFDCPWPKSLWALLKIIWPLTRRNHDYGTCVYAMSISALATYYYASSKLGVTGFQASCADMDFLARTRHMKHGFRLLDYGDLLYPQSLYKFNEILAEKLIQENAKHLREKANQLLIESPEAHPEVRAHWERLAQLEVVA